MDALIQQFFNVEIMARVFPLVLNGLGIILLVCAAVVPLGLFGGLLIAFGMQSRWRVVRFLIAAEVDFFRSVPPLVLLIFIYSGLPFVGFRPSPYVAVCLAFLLNTSAYYGEVYRAGFESVGTGQWEAARSTGLTTLQAWSYIMLPQAVRERPPRPAIQHHRGRKTYRAGERRGTAGNAVFFRYGALGYPECFPDGACGRDLSASAMAIGAPRQQAGAPARSLISLGH